MFLWALPLCQRTRNHAARREIEVYITHPALICLVRAQSAADVDVRRTSRAQDRHKPGHRMSFAGIWSAASFYSCIQICVKKISDRKGKGMKKRMRGRRWGFCHCTVTLIDSGLNKDQTLIQSSQNWCKGNVISMNIYRQRDRFYDWNQTWCCSKYLFFVSLLVTLGIFLPDQVWKKYFHTHTRRYATTDSFVCRSLFSALFGHSGCWVYIEKTRDLSSLSLSPVSHICCIHLQFNHIWVEQRALCEKTMLSCILLILQGEADGPQICLETWQQLIAQIVTVFSCTHSHMFAWRNTFAHGIIKQFCLTLWLWKQFMKR